MSELPLTPPSSPAAPPASPPAAPAAPVAASPPTPPSPPSSPTAPATPPSRPDWLPESYFDAQKGPKWDDFGKHYAEQATALAAENVRKAALPAKPDEYKLGTSSAFKPPEGVEFKIDDANPLWSQARAWAHKNGLSQDAFHEAVDLFAGYQVGDAQSVKTARDAEIAKLGAAGSTRVTAVNTWLDAVGAPGLKGRMFTAQDVQDFERLVSKFTNGGAASFSQSHRDPGAQQGLVTEEQWGKMTPAERLDYTRSPAAVAARQRAGT